MQTDSPDMGLPPFGLALDLSLEDTPEARQAFARQLARLGADLTRQASATRVLQGWCDTYGSAQGAAIEARRVEGLDRPAPAYVRSALAVGPDQALSYRRVQLVCGDLQLVSAHNWFRRDALTPQMADQLASTDVPFGLVVRDLDYRRETLTAETLFDPGEAEANDRGRVDVPDVLLRHRAVLILPDGRPLAFVDEVYGAGIPGLLEG